MSSYGYKRCSKCGEEKPIEAFYRIRKNEEPRHSHCAECNNWYRNNKGNPRPRKYTPPVWVIRK